jgi:hypothetical protein
MCSTIAPLCSWSSGKNFGRSAADSAGCGLDVCVALKPGKASPAAKQSDRRNTLLKGVFGAAKIAAAPGLAESMDSDTKPLRPREQYKYGAV